MLLRPAVLLLLLGAILSPPRSLAALQSDPQREDLRRWRDSLATVSDTLALLDLEARTIEIAKQNRDDPMIHLQLGFIAYRLGELTGGKGRYDAAAGEFEWAAELRPTWPVPWYGLGLAELAMGEHWWIALENLRQLLHKDYLSKAAAAFARAAEVDPSFADAVIDLANTALAQRIDPRLDVALGAVRQAAASEAGRNPRLQLARGRVEREAGEADSALVAFQRHLQVGGDSGLGLLELARTQFFVHRAVAAAQAYYAGAALARTPDAVALYRGDLEWIATPEELAAFDSAGARRAEWLRRFWQRRDVAEAREPGERLAEHYRRYFYARHNFRLVSRHRYYSITEVYRPAQRVFDDRGVIYIRHGEPDGRARLLLESAPNESWLYRRVDGDLIFHFVAASDVQDYKLIESLADVHGFRARFAAEQGATGFASELFASRAQLNPIYRRPLSRMTLTNERALVRRSVAIGTTTDSYQLTFARSLEPAVSDFVVGDGAGGAQLYVMFALPGERLAGAPTDSGVAYPIRFRLVVSDSANDPVAELDTVRTFRTRGALTAGTYLQGVTALPVPPGRYRYRLVMEQAGARAGELVRRDSLRVGRFDGRRFDASDLVLGHDRSSLAWVAGHDTVGLDPLERVPEGVPAHLYLEVYGLAPGQAYRTQIRLERLSRRSLFGAIGSLFGGSRPPLRLAFDGVATGPAMPVAQVLDLRGARRGKYLLTVELTNVATGETLRRARAFEVTPPPPVAAPSPGR